MPASKLFNPEELVPGRVVLFGSGETSSSGRKVYDWLLRSLPDQPRVALLETPAGYELNSLQVIQRVAEFFRHRLRNYSPLVEVVRARRRYTPHSPDDPKIAEQLLDADLIFMGPGSPTYAVRQLERSVTWHYLQARYLVGASVVFASAAVVAISAFALPVYEIYKVGEDIHWKAGLDFFGAVGLPIVFVPHWNNNDGGEDLDTSRCFMGRERFAELLELLPQGLTVVGIDENTALVMNLVDGMCEVRGLGSVTLIRTGLSSPGSSGYCSSTFESGKTFLIDEHFECREPRSKAAPPPEAIRKAIQAQSRQAASRELEAHEPQSVTSAEVQRLVLERQAARLRKDWGQSDALRKEIAALGWAVQDTPEGPLLAPADGPKPNEVDT